MADESRDGSTMLPARPSPEVAGDVVPTPDEFAGWPRLGVLSDALPVGPVRVRLERIDEDVRASLDRWARPPSRPAGRHGDSAASRPPESAGWDGLAVDLEFTRSQREGYLALVPGGRARLLSWREGSGLVMATHGAALLMNGDATHGIVVVARLLAPDLDLALQNVLRVATAWRLALSGRGLLLHCAAVEHADGCILFLGPSGAGKTTAVRMSWPRPALADDVVLLTSPRSGSGPWLAHPTPLWAEPAFPGRTVRASPVPAIAALRIEQDGTVSIQALHRAAAAACILAHAPFLEPIGPSLLLSQAESLARGVRFGVLRLGLGADFWPALEAWLDAIDACQPAPETSAQDPKERTP